MDAPLVRSISEVIGSRARSAAAGMALATVTAGLLLVSIAFLVASGVVLLTQVIGFPASALVFAAAFAVAALGTYLLRRSLIARRDAQTAATRNRVAADIALATTLVRSARPLAPFAAFIVAFAMARRA